MTKIKCRFKFYTLVLLCTCFFNGLAQENGQTHKVAKGETIVSIAKKYNVTPYDLQQANQIDLATIRPDDVLIIPKSAIQSAKNHPVPQPPEKGKTPSELQYTVLKGDTKFSLAKRFEITINALENQNPHIIPGLQEGQVLAVSSGKHSPSKNETPQNYVVTRMDTKFGLAKKFNTTIAALERQNPHIVKLLVVGQTIEIPSNPEVESETVKASTSQANKTPSTTKLLLEEKEVHPKPQTTAVATRPSPEKSPEAQPKATPQVIVKETSSLVPMDLNNAKYESYEVRAHETLYSLAQKANMSIPEFLKLNPQLKESVQAGISIKMPSNISNAEATPVTSKPVNLLKTLNTSKSNRLLFFLPFSQIEFEDYGADNNFSSVSNDFKKKHLEFYRGASIAIDSLKKLGLKLDVEILRIPNTTENIKITDFAKTDALNAYDAVIASFYKNIDAEATAFISTDAKPIVTVAHLNDQKYFKNLYSALPPLDFQRKKTLDYVLSQKGNIVVVNDLHREESRSFIQKHAPNAMFVDLKQNGTFSNDDLISKLKKNQRNYVVIDSDRNSVFITTTNLLLGQLSNYDIQIAILESQLIPDQNEVSKKRYQVLKMLFPSFSPAKKTADEKLFAKSYQKKYRMLPTTNVLLGFDITFDTLLRLGQAQSFENTAEKHVTQYTHLKFDYGKHGKGAYDNRGIYILHYDTGSDLKEVN